MWTIFTRILKDRRLLILIYTFSTVAFLWMYVGFFPSFKDQTASIEQMMSSYPESLMKAFNIDLKSFSTVEGFVATEQFSFVWPIIVIFMLVGFAGAAFSGEVEKGTVELLLAQPISRIKIFIARYLAGISMLIFFVTLSIFALMPLCKIYDIALTTDHIYSMGLLSFLFGLAIYSIAMFLSSVFSDKGKVYFISGGILVLMYVLNILAGIKENLSDLKYGSFFYYFNPTKALVYGDIDRWSYLIFLGTAVILFILSLIWISKRDVTT